MAECRSPFIPVPNTGCTVPCSRTITINGTTYDLSQNRSWTVSGSGGTVTVTAPLSGDGSSGNPIVLDYTSDFILDSGALSLNLDATTLPTLSISRTWTLYKSDGTTPFPTTTIGSSTVSSSMTTSSVTVPRGCIMSYNGTATVAAVGVGQSPPTLMSGSWTWTPNPPTSFPASSNLATTGLTTTTTYTVTESKPKTGLIVSGTQVIRATGNDTSTTSDTGTFNDVFYWGYTNALGSGIVDQATVDTLVAANIEALTSYKFGTKAQTLTGVNDSSGYRVIFAYLASAGNVSNIVLNSATSVLGAYLKRTSDLSITTISGASYTFRIYVAVADNSYPGSNTLAIT